MIPTEENKEFNGIENDDSINLKEQFEKYSIHWRWFLIGVLTNGKSSGFDPDMRRFDSFYSYQFKRISYDIF